MKQVMPLKNSGISNQYGNQSYLNKVPSVSGMKDNNSSYFENGKKQE
jgi:hypothetical protein